MAAHLDVTVYEGRALLTGTAPDPQIKAQAGEAAGGIPGVRAVYNEIEVAPNESAWNSTKDAWITSEVRSSLRFSNVRSVNYNVETVDRSVYLIGSARSQDELNPYTDLARNVSGAQPGGFLCRGPAGRAARFCSRRNRHRRRLRGCVRQPGSATPCFPAPTTPVESGSKRPQAQLLHDISMSCPSPRERVSEANGWTGAQRPSPPRGQAVPLQHVFNLFTHSKAGPGQQKRRSARIYACAGVTVRRGRKLLPVVRT